jgi:alpha-tubulin suppressor-like RCC1 family protein
MIHVLEFISFEEFKIWYTDPSAASSSNGVGNADAKQYMHHMLPGRARKLVAGATCFALLGEEGEMFTWGDARHARCLARTSDADYPADKPCLVEALGGIPIEKIDGRGWMFGALSREKDLYLWGSEKPGGKGGLKQLLGTGEEEIKLVEIDSVESVMDFGIGAGHVAVISEEGDVWVAGDNQNKQLGLGEYSEKLVGVWTKTAISNTIKPLEVVTGDLCTFLKA